MKRTRKVWAVSRKMLIAGLSIFLMDLSMAAREEALTTSWYHFDPFLHAREVEGVKVWTGMDVELLDKIFKHAGMSYSAKEEVSWPELLTDVAEGRRDFAIGAFKTAEREKFAYFSEPYRMDPVALFVPRGQAREYRFEDLDGLFRIIRERNLKLGVVRGWSYTAEIDPFLAEAANEGRLVYTETEDLLPELLLEGRADAYMSGRIPGQTLLWQSGHQGDIEEYPRILSASPIYAIFSKKTVSPETVERFNRSLQAIKDSGEYHKVIRGYVFPILLSMTLETRWFAIIIGIGVVTFCLSGIVLGRAENYSIFGTFILAALPAMGGGIARDILLGRVPSAVRSPTYVFLVIGTVLVSFVFFRVVAWVQRRHPGRVSEMLSRYIDLATEKLTMPIVNLFDGIGIGVYTVIGVVAAVSAQCEPLWLWGPFFGVMTGVGGSIIRDVMRSNPDIVNLKGRLYAEVSLAWALFLSLFLIWASDRLNPGEVFAGVMVAICGAFVCRMVAFRYEWSSPMM